MPKSLAEVAESERTKLVAPNADAAGRFAASGEKGDSPLTVWVPNHEADQLRESFGFKVPGAVEEPAAVDKDAEIARLTAEMERLTAEMERLTAENATLRKDADTIKKDAPPPDTKKR
jgi:hypothetical protein